MNHSRTKHECTTSQPFQMLPWILAFSVLFTLIGAERSSAQNESGRRILDKRYFGHRWYDSTKHKYHLRVPIIKRLPPLTSDMPHDVLTAYLHLDSLARFNANHELVISPQGWLAQPELLRKTLASYYRVMDYDPLRYQQYERETALKSSLFRSNLIRATGYLDQAVGKIASSDYNKRAYTQAIISDYVLRVKILAVDSMWLAYPIEPGGDPMEYGGGRYIFNAMAQVLDTLKGQKFITCQEQKGIDDNQPMALSSSPCIYFQYVSKTQSDFPIYDRDEDSTFIEAGRGFAMRPGQEAVVFLYFSNQQFDSTHDAFQLYLGPPASDWALPIINGQIRDRNHVWSDNMTMNYADWRRRFLELRDKIVNGNY